MHDFVSDLQASHRDTLRWGMGMYTLGKGRIIHVLRRVNDVAAQKAPVVFL